MEISEQRRYTEKEWKGKVIGNAWHDKLSKEWPSTLVHFLRTLIPERQEHLICEVGCAIGRGAFVFSPQYYIGVDINEHAIKEAKKIHPKHSFQTITWGGDVPSADVYLFVHVLLHVSDDEIRNVLAPCLDNRKARVLVIESMCRCMRWRSTWHPRNLEDYDAIFGEQRYSKTTYIRNRINTSPYFQDYCLYEFRGD